MQLNRDMRAEMKVAKKAASKAAASLRSQKAKHEKAVVRGDLLEYGNVLWGAQGRPYTDDFEDHVRRLLSVGTSAEGCRKQLLYDCKYFLGDKAVESGHFKVPKVDWFCKMRESMGIASWLYSMIEIYSAEDVKQFGFDETGMSGVPTMNMWALLEKAGAVKVVKIGVADILVGGTAENCADHIEKCWKRGGQCIELLREDLGPELAESLLPKVRGGLELHKIGATQNDSVRPPPPPPPPRPRP